MITPDQIPDEAWEAAMKTDPRDGLRAAIAAALNAWPGMLQHSPDGLDPIINPSRIVLPLPQEK